MYANNVTRNPCFEEFATQGYVYNIFLFVCKENLWRVFSYIFILTKAQNRHLYGHSVLQMELLTD